jgi:hypothetical protein
MVSWVCLLCNPSRDWPRFEPATDDLSLWFAPRLIRDSSKGDGLDCSRQDLSLRQLKTLRTEKVSLQHAPKLCEHRCHEHGMPRQSADPLRCRLAGLAGYAITQLSRAGLKLDAINFPGFALSSLGVTQTLGKPSFVHLSRPRFSVAR